jgi:VWFA-related protein
MRRLLALAVLFAPLSLLLAAQAQQPATDAPAQTTAPAPAPYVLHRNVSLVFLDGVALDPQGRVVTDLKQSDFQVTEDGEPQKIRNFEEPGKNTPSPDVTIDSTADLDRLAPRAPVNIVLLDEFNTRFEDMAFARYSLKKWLEKQPTKLDTPTMLIAVSLEHFTVLRDYTQSKDEIITALDKHFVAYPWHLQSITWTPELFGTAHLALRQVAEATAGHQGPKSMIWLGRGFPTIGLRTHAVDTGRTLHTTTQHTIDELRDARVTLYTIDPAGVMIDPGVYGQEARDFAPFGGDPRFQALATATGGRNLYGRNDVDKEIDSSIRDGASLYTLTYVPANDDNPGKFRKIKVTIDRPGITFVTRPGYFPTTQPHVGKDGSLGNRLSAEMAGAGSSNMEFDAVEFTTTVSPTDTNNIGVHLNGHGISYYIPKDESKPRHTRLIVLATTFDKKNKELKRQANMYDFVAPDAPHIGHITNPLNFDFKLKPDSKATHVRFVVRVEASGRMGTADLALTPGATASSAKVDATSVPTPPAASTPPAS